MSDPDIRVTALYCIAQFELAGIAERVLAAADKPLTKAVNAKDSEDNAPLSIAA